MLLVSLDEGERGGLGGRVIGGVCVWSGDVVVVVVDDDESFDRAANKRALARWQAAEDDLPPLLPLLLLRLCLEREEEGLRLNGISAW